MGRQRVLLALIMALVIGAVLVIVNLPTRLGLDLRGGAELTIQVKTTPEVPRITEREMEAVQEVVENRVNGLGVSEAVVQTSGQDQILVQLPGVNDPQQAERVLGETAQLEFRLENFEKSALFRVRQQELQQLLTEQAQLATQPDANAARIAELQDQIQAKQAQIDEIAEQVFDRTELTGKFLNDALAAPTQGDNWLVELRFDDRGAELFADLTKKAATDGLRLGIFLDDQLISAPTVSERFKESGITGGEAVIEGRFTSEEARELELQLRGGALPVPIEVVQNRTVGATLGRDSIQKSLYAGLGGLMLVLVFMVAYYRLPGMIANLSLIIYALLTFAAFKLLNVTLTLPGIAGFILSIGMAVDANVLIFERLREELRSGKTLYRSVEAGFNRAFSSILDSNVTTLIACGALFWLGTSLVRGFALTLAIGVAISIFTAVSCSRTLLMIAITIQDFRKPNWFCPGLTAIGQAQTGATS